MASIRAVDVGERFEKVLAWERLRIYGPVMRAAEV